MERGRERRRSLPQGRKWRKRALSNGRSLRQKGLPSSTAGS